MNDFSNIDQNVGNLRKNRSVREVRTFDVIARQNLLFSLNRLTAGGTVGLCDVQSRVSRLRCVFASPKIACYFMSALITHPTIRSLLRGVLVWAPLWIGTTVGFTALGVGYVVLMKDDTFLASQAMLVRDEATGAVMRLGRFQSQTEMKAAQETILEMAKSQQVVRDALVAVGKPASLSNGLDWGGDYPSKELIEEVAKSSISVHAPKGTEFGVTEVIYLDVKAQSQTEAIALSKSLCDALESRLQQVRKARADGVISELTHARDSAKRDLASATDRLLEIERSAGSDLTDLRGLTDTIAGAATSRAEFDQIKSEIRQAEVSRYSLMADREMLIKATEDPSSFIVAPGAVLNSQPGLKRLREGLVDAQLSGSQLSGKFTDSHPLVNASQTAQSAIVRRLLQELKASVASVESDIALVDRKVAELEARRTAAENRLSRIADGRATYANVLSEVRSKLLMVEGAERSLAEANAARDSSTSTSLLTRLDAPMVSDRPIGPGRTTIVGLCGIAGLVFGLGIVFVISPIDSGPSFGRRAADRARGRRGIDTPPQESPAPAEPARQEATIKHSKLSLHPSPLETSPVETSPVETSPVETLASSIAALSSEMAFPNPGPALAKSRSDKALPVTEVDKAFQELAKLQSIKPNSRAEELSIQMKVQELKRFLAGNPQANQAGTEENPWNHEDPPRQKPRPTPTK